MVVPIEKSSQIVNAFLEYVRTQNESLINGFKLKDIKFALLQYHADKGFPFYKAMEMRIEELEKKAESMGGSGMSITESDIQKYTPKQILGILSKFSLGAWSWIVGILVFVLGLSFQLEYSVGSNKGKSEVADSASTTSLQGLTVEQLILLREIWTYQKTNNLSKVVIDREGFVLDDAKGEKTKINLAVKALGEDRGYPLRFEQLMVSMPAQFLRLIPETRFDSPYVVSVPEEVRKILDRD